MVIPGVQGGDRCLGEDRVRADYADGCGARRSKANRATAVLNHLVHLGLVERREVGSAALVRLVRENKAARSVLALVDLQEGVTARLRAEAENIQPAPASLVLFG